MGINWTALIIMNNYFHDVATATMLSSAVILWVLGRQAEKGGPEERRALAKALPTLTRFAIGALIWIILGGIPRVIFFNTFEFIPAKDNGIIIDLAIKHIFLFGFTGAGVAMWLRMGKVARGEITSAADKA